MTSPKVSSESNTGYRIVVRLDLSKIQANIISDGCLEPVMGEEIMLEIPAKRMPDEMGEMVRETIGHEFTDMAKDSLYRINVLAALKGVIL